MIFFNTKIPICLTVLFVIRECSSYRVYHVNPYEVDNVQQPSVNYAYPPKKEQKYYQDIYIAQLIPEEIEYGHVKETPFSWEQRFEKINLDDNRHQGKVKWNDPHTGYGEFYYDFNHDNEDEEEKKEEDPHEGKKQTLQDILDDGRRSYEKGEVEFIDGKSYDGMTKGKQDFHGGNYKTDPGQANKDNKLLKEEKKSKFIG